VNTMITKIGKKVCQENSQMRKEGSLLGSAGLASALHLLQNSATVGGMKSKKSASHIASLLRN